MVLTLDPQSKVVSLPAPGGNVPSAPTFPTSQLPAPASSLHAHRNRCLPPLPCTSLDTYMRHGVYKEHGICVRSPCRAEPPRDLEPSGLLTTVGGRDRASTSYAAADRVKAPASAARGRFRGIHGGRTAPSLPAEARTTSGGGCLAGSVPSVLVRSRGCSRTPPRPHGISQHQRKGRQGEDDAAQTANVTKEKRNENQSDQRIRGRPGQGPALLYGGTGLCQEGRFQSGPISLADRGLARGAGRH